MSAILYIFHLIRSQYKYMDCEHLTSIYIFHHNINPVYTRTSVVEEPPHLPPRSDLPTPDAEPSPDRGALVPESPV